MNVKKWIIYSARKNKSLKTDRNARNTEKNRSSWTKWWKKGMPPTKQKNNLGYRKRKTYAAAANDKKREENRSGLKERENNNRIEMVSRVRDKTRPDR